MILSDPHTHTHPGYLGRENIIGIVLKDQVFSRFYEHDAPGYVPRCVHTYDPRFQTKSLFSVRNLSGDTYPGSFHSTWNVVADVCHVFFNSVRKMSGHSPLIKACHLEACWAYAQRYQPPWLSRQWRKWVCVCVSDGPNGWSGLKNFGHQFFSSECIQITRKLALEQAKTDACGYALKFSKIWSGLGLRKSLFWPVRPGCGTVE